MHRFVLRVVGLDLEARRGIEEEVEVERLFALVGKLHDELDLAAWLHLVGAGRELYDQVLLHVDGFDLHRLGAFDLARAVVERAHEIELEAFSGGLSGNAKVGYSLMYDATYFVSDAFSLHAGFYNDRSPDWLVWQRENLVGSFRRRELDFNAGLDWTIDSRQELRVKLQAIALDADLRRAYRVGANAHAVATGEPVDDFNVTNLGFQIRYRYELAPLSYLYVVYGRGGYRLDDFSGQTGHLLRDSFSLRDDEQLLVKFSYRFEL